jgi:hypothetical protein
MLGQFQDVSRGDGRKAGDVAASIIRLVFRGSGRIGTGLLFLALGFLMLGRRRGRGLVMREGFTVRSEPVDVGMTSGVPQADPREQNGERNQQNAQSRQRAYHVSYK